MAGAPAPPAGGRADVAGVVVLLPLLLLGEQATVHHRSAIAAAGQPGERGGRAVPPRGGVFAEHCPALRPAPCGRPRGAGVRGGAGNDDHLLGVVDPHRDVLRALAALPALAGVVVVRLHRAVAGGPVVLALRRVGPAVLPQVVPVLQHAQDGVAGPPLAG